MPKPPIDPGFAFDPLDTSRSKDPELWARIRRERGVCRTAPGIVFTARYAETGEGTSSPAGTSPWAHWVTMRPEGWR